MKKTVKQRRYKNSAFLFNVKDWHIDTAEMTSQEKGYYVNLLSLQWANGEISADPRRLWSAVAAGDPYDVYDLNALKARWMHECGISNIVSNRKGQPSVTDSVIFPTFKSFVECWQNIKSKFSVTENGGLKNYRLEEEREAVYEYDKGQQDRTAKARAARWPNKENGAVKSSVTESVTERASGGKTEKSNFGKTSVTGTNSNSNSNTVTNNKQGGNLSLKTEEKNNTPGPREFCLLRGQQPSLRLVLYVSDTFTCREIEALLSLNLESLVMQGEIWRLPDDYQTMIFETYFSEKIAEADDYTSGKIRKDFIWWYPNKMKMLERKYNESRKTEQWFRQELAMTNGACKDESVKQEFIDYYLNRLPSGKFYFQTLNNFSVMDSLKKWVKEDYKTVKKIKETVVGPVIPRDGESIADLKKHYKPQ